MITLRISSKKANKVVSLELPLTENASEFEEKFEEYLSSELDGNVDDYMFTPCLPFEFTVGATTTAIEYNDLALRLNSALKMDQNATQALLEIENIEDALDTLESTSYTFYPDTHTPKELGQYVVDNGLLGVDIPIEVVEYMDLESLGNDWAEDMEETSYGYIRLW